MSFELAAFFFLDDDIMGIVKYAIKSLQTSPNFMIIRFSFKSKKTVWTHIAGKCETTSLFGVRRNKYPSRRGPPVPKSDILLTFLSKNA